MKARKEEPAVVEQLRDKSFYFARYSTGTVRLIEQSYARLLLVITNAQELPEGALETIVAIFKNEDTFSTQAFLRNGAVFNYSKKLEPGLTAILQASLEPVDKLVLLIGLHHMSLKLSAETVREIAAKRAGVAKLIAKEDSPAEAMKCALAPDFNYEKGSLNDAEFRKLCLIKWFLSSKEQVSYSEFVAALPADAFFKPVARKGGRYNHNIYLVAARMSEGFYEDLTPQEMLRFISHFCRNAPWELRPWLRERFDAHVVAAYNSDDVVLDYRWGNMKAFLTKEELEDFKAFVEKSSLANKFLGVAGERTAALLAYIFIEGGPTIFEEFLLHYKTMRYGNEMLGEYARLHPIAIFWKDEETGVSSKLKIFAYIDYIKKGIYKEMPLEWHVAVA